MGFSTKPELAAPLEVGEVAAGEESDEIGRGVDGLPVDQLHRVDGTRRCRVSSRGAQPRRRPHVEPVGGVR